jgi:hypothetical protein
LTNRLGIVGGTGVAGWTTTWTETDITALPAVTLIIPVYVPAASKLGSMDTLNTAGRVPVAGLTLSHPCGFVATATENGVPVEPYRETFWGEGSDPCCVYEKDRLEGSTLYSCENAACGLAIRASIINPHDMRDTSRLLN